MDSETQPFAELALKVASAVIAAFGLAYVVRKHGLEWGVKLRFSVRPTREPPIEMQVLNLSKIAVQLRTLRVQRHAAKETIKEFPLDRLIPSEQAETVQIHDQLNEYIWEKRIDPAKPLAPAQWREERELLDVSLVFDSRAKTRNTRWVRIEIVIKVHPRYGSRVEGVKTA